MKYFWAKYLWPILQQCRLPNYQLTSFTKFFVIKRHEYQIQILTIEIFTQTIPHWPPDSVPHSIKRCVVNQKLYFWSIRSQNVRNLCMNWGCLDCIFLIQRLKVGRYLTVLVQLSTRKIMSHHFSILIDDTNSHSSESWYNHSKLFPVWNLDFQLLSRLWITYESLKSIHRIHMCLRL